MFVCMHVCECVQEYVCVYAHECICACVCVRVCVCAHMCFCTFNFQELLQVFAYFLLVIVPKAVLASEYGWQ